MAILMDDIGLTRFSVPLRLKPQEDGEPQPSVDAHCFELDHWDTWCQQRILSLFEFIDWSVYWLCLKSPRSSSASDPI
jgi:hypothetical protein